MQRGRSVLSLNFLNRKFIPGQCMVIAGRPVPRRSEDYCLIESLNGKYKWICRLPAVISIPYQAQVFSSFLTVPSRP